jgi:hypothetical protein
MKRVKILNRRSTTLLAGAALLAGLVAFFNLTAPVATSLTTTGAAASTVAQFPPAGFAAKVRGDAILLNKFASDLVTWEERANAMKAKPARTAADLTGLRNGANDLKRRAPEMKRLVQKLIDNLKSGGHLGTPVDKWMEDQLKKKNSSIIAELKGVSGLLNQSLAEFDQLPGELDSVVREIATNKKAANSPTQQSVLVRASFSPTPVAFGLRTCLLPKIAAAFCTFADLDNCREGAEKDLKKCRQAL